jgi:hypothetical protein
MDTQQTSHAETTAETTTAQTETAVELEDMHPDVKAIVPGSMSGAEMIAYWEREGVFETFWSQYEDIGPGKRFADSTEYVQHMRRQPVRQGK